MRAKISNPPQNGKRYTVAEVRRKILLYVCIGGLMPITETGKRNLANRFKTTFDFVDSMVRSVENDLARGACSCE